MIDRAHEIFVLVKVVFSLNLRVLTLVLGFLCLGNLGCWSFELFLMLASRFRFRAVGRRPALGSLRSFFLVSEGNSSRFRL